MVVEILGTRVIAPVFGASLAVWSALLAVTLGSLALGYYMGGRLVDGQPSTKTLNWTTVVAGVLLGVTPALRHSVLSMTESLGPRIGPLVSASLLFAPSLTVLGGIGPIAIRLVSDDVASAGRRAGLMFAVSTAGSLLGVFVTAFGLIPNFETQQILLGAAVVLVVTGAVPLTFRNNKVALFGICAPWLSVMAPAVELPAGFRIVDTAQSMYGRVQVIDDESRKVRFLRVDHSVIGADLMPEHESAFAFVHVLELARPLRPNARSMLQLGLGTGSLSRSLDNQGIVTDVVEIDPIVARFAQQHFNFHASGDLFIEDARAYLNRTQRKYDVIVHDTFTGGSTPEHLLSREVLEAVRHALHPGGLALLNFVGETSGAESQASTFVARTAASVFKHVRAFRDDASGDGGVSNIVFFASDSDLELSRIERIRFRDRARETVRRSLFANEVLQGPIAAHARGGIITDAANPLARLELPIAEQHAAAMNQLLPLEVWLH